MFLNIKNIPWPQFSGLKIVAICGQLVLRDRILWIFYYVIYQYRYLNLHICIIVEVWHPPPVFTPKNNKKPKTSALQVLHKPGV